MTKIPEATIRRLSIYMRILEGLEHQGTSVISSSALAGLCGFKSAQIRKDLAYFGAMGVRGVGYYVSDLKQRIQQILGIEHIWNAALIGYGNLGHALAAYQGFAKSGFHIRVIYDQDASKLSQVPHGLHAVNQEKDLVSALHEHKIQVGIFTVTAAAAQQVANLLVAEGVQGILNFTPVRLRVPDYVRVKYVDFSIELEGLAYHLSKDPSRKPDFEV